MMKELGYKIDLGQKITEKMKEDFGAYMAVSATIAIAFIQSSYNRSLHYLS